jgi:hypothetical protein
MLRIDKVEIIDGVTVYGDSDEWHKFYIVPIQASYRMMPDGSFAYKFIKYRFPIDRGPEKPAGGGYLLFDTEFVVPNNVLEDITGKLQTRVNQKASRRGVSPAPEVVIGTLTYTKGAVSLIFAGGGDDNSGGTFVEKYSNVGKPSLYGKNIASFGLELTQEGAPFYEQAMQGQGGAVSVVYDLHFHAELPPINIIAKFRAREFYSFFQTVNTDTDWPRWKENEHRETIREKLISSESMSLDFDWGGVTDEEIRQPIREWASRTLEDSVERKMIAAIVPVPEDQRELPEDIDSIKRDIKNKKISSFTLRYNEKMPVEWNIAPQGMLQNITSLIDGNGNPVVWEDYAQIVDLDDPFFRQLRVDTYVNADFEKLPIHSVEVKVLYDGKPMPNLIEGQPEGEAILRAPDDVGKFASFIKDDVWDYTYSYQVNYKGHSRIFQSEEILTNEGNLTIGVDDVGILDVTIKTGDLNWADVESALVTFEYEDSSAGVDLIKDQFTLTKTLTEHHIQEVIFAPMRKNYKYQVKYFMKNGKEFEGEQLSDRSSTLFINDVFGGRKTIALRGIGDFENRISKIFMNLSYEDESNEYEQSTSIALSKDLQFFDWTFPVINDSLGGVSYQGNVVYSDGTSEEIPSTVADSSTILVPQAIENLLEVTVVPDLLDWTVLKMAMVKLSYVDEDNDVSERETLVFSDTRTPEQPWKVELRDKDKSTYQYTVTYFPIAGENVVVGPLDETSDTIVLELP